MAQQIAAWAQVVAAYFIIIAAAQTARGDLRHLYTFNDETASDSVGNANGQVLGSASIDVDGILQLPGGADNYVSLDGPAIDIGSYTDVTFESWFTIDGLLNWQRVFDFGDRTVPNNQQGYIYYTPQSSFGDGLGVYATFGGRTEAPHAPLEEDQLYHLAMVIDDDANGGSDELNVYINGNLQASVGHNRSLSDVSDTFAWIGKSLVAADPNFIGRMDEFRIHDTALDADAVAASYSAGPTPQLALILHVNTVTGSVEITADESATVTFDYYTITSAAEALDPDGWSSLDEQNLNSMGPGEGQSWDEAENSDPSQLAELFLLGASTATDSAPIELGQAFDPTRFGLGNPGDLVFQFSRQRSPILQLGEVVYITSDSLFGDYNNNGTVDAADYTAWLAALGGTELVNDPTPGAVDQSDYVYWKAHFGETAGAGAGSARLALEESSSIRSSAPEPSALLLSVLGSLVCVVSRRGLVRENLVVSVP